MDPSGRKGGWAPAVAALLMMGGLPPAAQGMARELRADAPLAFVENAGQWDTPARFAARGAGWTAGLEPGALAFELRGAEGARAVRLAFEGARADAALLGEERLPGTCSYFAGSDPRAWCSGVASYGSVLYRGLYPGIDLRLREGAGRLEYDVLLAPGADLAAFSVACEGVLGLELEPGGGLLLRTESGPLRQDAPRTWEVLPSGERRPVDCRFALRGERRYGFELAARDEALPLVIDPGLEWAVTLGGCCVEWLTGAAVDAAGRVFATGMTRSDDFPGAWGSLGGPQDAFVACLDPSAPWGSPPLWTTYLGGKDEDVAYRLAVDDAGNLNLVGETRSPNFPTTPGAFDATLGGPQDAFVAVMDPAGLLLYSTYLGGGGEDSGLVLDLGHDGTAAVAGKTLSADFPTTPGAFDESFNGGGTDVFVSVLRPGGAGAADLVYSTYLGGSDLEGVFPDPDLILMGIDHFQGDGVVVAASTRSDDLPLVHPYQAARAGEFDIFVSVLRPDGQGAQDLIYSTYVGSPGTEQPMAVVADPSGSISVGGGTWSAAFPTTHGALQEVWGGGSIDAVWFRLDPHQAGAGQLVYSTYWGGNSIDHIADFELEPSGSVIATGWTGFGSGPPTDLRTTCGAYDTTPDGFTDGFVMRFTPEGNGGADLLYSSLLGGPDTDGLFALDVVSPGPQAEVLVAGWSSKDPDFTGPSTGMLGQFTIAPQIERYGLLTPNSVGPGAIIGASCSASLADNTFALKVSGAVPGQIGFFFYGPEVLWAPLGDGLLCVGGGPNIIYAVLGPPQTIDASGNASRWVDLGAPPAGGGPAEIAWDSTWSFQFIYLDPAAGGAGYNLSDALRVSFTP